MLTVEVFPWRATWRGGRLMDIMHAESGDSAIACVQVGAYDWVNGRLEREPSAADLRDRLQRFADEDGPTYAANEVPYAR
jgi:type II secretory pathway component PulJ